MEDFIFGTLLQTNHGSHTYETSAVESHTRTTVFRVTHRLVNPFS